MRAIDNYHGIATSLLRSLFLVINVIFVSLCKCNVKNHLLNHLKFSHIWENGVKSFMYVIALFFAFDVMLSQICNRTMLGG